MDRRATHDWAPLYRYGVAAVVTLAAVALRYALVPLIGEFAPFLTVFPIVVIIAWYARLGPAMVSLVIGLFGIWFFVLQPDLQFEGLSSGAITTIIVYLVMGTASAFVGDSANRANRRAARNAEAMGDLADSLKESEAEYRRLFDSAGTGNTEIDIETGLFLRVNQRYCDLLGYDSDEIVGKLTFQDITHEDDREFSADLLRAFTRGGQDRMEIEKRYIRKDGSVMWAHVVISIIYGADGKAKRMLGSLVDITARRRAEEALRTSEEFTRRITEVAPCIMYVYDLEERRNIWGNREMTDALGYVRGDLDAFGGEIFKKLMHPDDFRAYQDYAARLLKLADGEGIEFEYRVKNKAGEWRWLYSRDMVFMRKDGGEVKQIVGAALDVTDRKAAEAALAESRERLQAALQGSGAGTFRWNVVTNQLDWDENLDRLFGLPPGETVRSLDAFISTIHPDERQEVVERCRRCADFGDDFDMEFRVVRPDGTIRWLSDKAKAFTDVEGKPAYLTGMCIDITERKQLADQLAEQRRLYKSITDNATTAILIMDEDQHCVFMNPAAEALTGFTIDETRGRTLHELLHHTRPDGSYYPMAECPIDQAFPTRHQMQGEEVFVHKDGHFYDVAFTASPLIDHDQQTVGTVIEVQDITARKLADTQLRNSETRLRLAARAAGMFSWENNLVDGTIVWGDNAASLLGVAVDDLPATVEGSHFFVSPSDRHRVLQEFVDAVAEQRPDFVSEFEGIDTGDGPRCWETHSRIIYDADGKPLRVFGITQDITLRKRAESEIRSSRERLEETLSNLEKLVSDRTRELEAAHAETVRLMSEVSSIQESERRRIGQDVHDHLGQSITGLRLNLQNLANELNGDSHVMERILTLREITTKLDSEVSYLAWTLRPSVLDDLGLVPAVQSFVEEWSRHFGIHAEFESFGVQDEMLSPQLETNLYRIAQEALTNCAKHSEATHVAVVLEQRQNTLTLIVEDDGRGFNITPKKTVTRSGSGLGLQGMRDRAALIGGKLEIESSPGSGTTVFLRVPLKSPASNGIHLPGIEAF